tara:strand:- start:44804 stop:47077 length:2274 start_codon:yes stop_codon:yes gene_type:complete
MQNSFIKNLKFDIPAGLVVFLVALPLCLGIALASGAPMFAGIIAGIIGGVVVGSISGSPLGVSGPAAGLAVIVADSIKQLGTNASGEFDMMAGFQAFLVAGVIAGVIQIILGAVRAGIIGYYFPTSVIQGMLAGIGITLILKQIPHALGWDKNPEGEWEFFQTDGHNSFSEIGYAFENFTMGAVLVTLIALGILILFQQPFMKKNKVLSLIPGPLIAVISGIVINEILKSYFPEFALVNETEVVNGEVLENNHMVNIKAADSEKPYYGLLTFPDWSILKNPSIYVIGFTMAIVASLETLLCVEATDKLDPQKRITPTNRELFAQGTGNVISSLIGGLPVTQVIVRSSANIDSGGKTKVSAISHGFFLATFVILLPWLLNLIPLSCLAAILLLVGYKLANIKLFKKMYHNGWSQFIPFVVTILVIVFANLLWGIVAGLIVSIFFILKQSYQNALYSKFIAKQEGVRNTTIIKLGEVVSFFNKGNLHKKLSEIPENADVVIDGRANKHLDYDIFDLFSDFAEGAKNKNMNLQFVGFDTQRSEKLNNFANEIVQLMNTQTKETQRKLTPEKAQRLLIEGNERFMKDEMTQRDLLEQMRQTTDGQFPHSVILSCIDSRTSSELIFDQGIGDIFNARVAGNVINDDVLGSIEYSCKVAGSKLVVVLGHSSCGAVTSACKHVELGNITTLLKKIQPAIDVVAPKVDDITAPESVQMVADENVKHAIEEIRNKSDILAQMEKEGEIKIVGGMYNIETGKVTFFE